MVTNNQNWRATEGKPDIPLLASFFQKGITEEIEYVKSGGSKKKGTGTGKTKLSRGQRSHSIANYTIYRFPLNPETKISEEDPIDIIFNKKTYSGNIVSIDETHIYLAIDTDLGEHIPEITIISDKTKTLTELFDKIGLVSSGRIDFNENGCFKLFGYVEPQKLNNPISHDLVQESFHNPNNNLNNNQKIAILKAASQEVTFIWGPPGTGKTQTLTEIINIFLKNQKRVLLASHTNLAIDQVLQRIAQNSNHAAIIEEGKILRCGIPSIKNGNIESLLPETILKRLLKPHYDNLEELKKKQKTLDKEYQAYQDAVLLSILISLDEIARERSIIEKKNQELLISIDQKKTQILALNSQKSQKLELLEQHESSFFIIRFFLQSKIEQLKREIPLIDNQISQEEIRIQSLYEQIAKNSQNVKTNQNAWQIADNNLKGILLSLEITPNFDLNTTSVKSKLSSLKISLDEISKKVQVINAIIEETKTKLFKNALLIGCTLTKSYLDSNIFRSQYDVLIIDEASMAVLPMVFFASGLVGPSSNHYIISGDFRQLPPVVQSKGKIATKWLKRDIFDQAEITVYASHDKDDDRLVMLTEQYRMHPDIVELINAPVYNNRLITNDDTRVSRIKSAKSAPFEERAVIVIDTSNLNPACHKTNTKARLNLYHAGLSVKLAEMAISGGFKKIGIISPYGSQAEIITKEIERRGHSTELVQVATVHRFQGSEKEIIILDIPDSPPISKMVFLKGGFKDFEQDAGKLINVAISRAQVKIVLIANMNYLFGQLSHEDALIQILEKVRSSGSCEIIDSRNLFNYSSLEESEIFKSGSIIEHDEEMTVWFEDKFYDALALDLKNAQERVIIYSPYVYENRLGKLMDQFHNLISRNISVYAIVNDPGIYTKNIKETNDLLDYMKKSGIHVIIASDEYGIKPNFHFKTVFIDNKVVYDGSLNILSQRETADKMTRSTKTTAEFLLKSYGTEKTLKKYHDSFPDKN
jgi:hypothetical protein